MPPTPFRLRRHRPHGGHAIIRLICVQHIYHNGKPLLYLIFEYLDTDLKKFIDSHRKGPNPSPLPSSQIQSLLFQLCKGIDHCHGHGVLHRKLLKDDTRNAEYTDVEKELVEVIALTEELLATAQDEAGNSGVGIGTSADVSPSFHHSGSTLQNSMTGEKATRNDVTL